MKMNLYRVSVAISSPETIHKSSTQGNEKGRAREGGRPPGGLLALRLLLRLGLRLAFGPRGLDEARDRGLGHLDADVLAFVDGQYEVVVLDLLHDPVDAGVG